jgi:hypothetical protein
MGDPTATSTAQQQAIRDAAEALTRLLDEVVPSNVAHYAVEDARRALRTLGWRAGGIWTHDVYERLAAFPSEMMSRREVEDTVTTLTMAFVRRV